MKKVKIKVAFLGHPLFSIDKARLETWQSDLWELVLPISTFTIPHNSDGYQWEYTDAGIRELSPNCSDADVLILVTAVPIQSNYIARVFDANKLCLSYHGLIDVLNYNNIPHENLLLNLLYSASIGYQYRNKKLLPGLDLSHLLHDEVRQCLFDMCGNKYDVVFSLNSPQICSSCAESLKNNGEGNRIGQDTIDTIQKELKWIRKKRFYLIADWIKQHPILALVISSGFAVCLGTASSLLASLMWEKFLKSMI